MSSLLVTSSFKSTVQGLGKTAKKSSGTPSFRTILSSLSCGEETPLRSQWHKPFNCRANRNQNRRIHSRTLAGTHYVFKGMPSPSPISSWIGRVTCMFTKGSVDEIAHYHSFPPSLVEAGLLKRSLNLNSQTSGNCSCPAYGPAQLGCLRKVRKSGLKQHPPKG